MNADCLVFRSGVISKALAVMSLATFWLLPFSPFVALAAVASTKNSSGWPRKLSITAAVLCIAYTLAVAVVFYCVTIYILSGGLDRHPNHGWWRY